MPWKLLNSRTGADGGGLTPEQEATLLYFKYNPNTDKLEAAKSIETILASIFLGGQHKVTSGGENIFVKNLTSDINYSAAWNGVKDQSQPGNQGAAGLISMTSRVHADLLEQVEPDGPISASDITGYQGDATFAENTTLFGVRFRLGQALAVGNILRYSLFLGTDDTGIKIYEQEQVVGTAASAGDFYDFWYDSPASLFGGTTVYAEITVESEQNADDQVILQVYATDADPNNRYTLANIRGFTDLDVLDTRDYRQRQLVRPGIKTDFLATALPGNTQIQLEADGAPTEFEVFFSGGIEADGRDGFTVTVPDQIINVPVGPLDATQVYHIAVDTNGVVTTSLTKTSVDAIDRVHLVSFTAINGQVIPEGLITNPFLAWSDKTLQGILETDGLLVKNFTIEDSVLGGLFLRVEDYTIVSNSGNYEQSNTNPHSRRFPSIDPFPWTYLHTGITAPPTVGVDVNLDPDQYDIGGALGPVPAGNATVQVLLLTRTGQAVILYGQTLFDRYEDAVLNIYDTDFTIPAGLLDAAEVARFALAQGATDISDVNEVSIAITAGAGGGSGQLPETTAFSDEDLEIFDLGDPSKRMKFDASNVPSGNTNVYGVPGFSTDLANARISLKYTGGASVTLGAILLNQDPIIYVSAPNAFTVFIDNENVKENAHITVVNLSGRRVKVDSVGATTINGRPAGNPINLYHEFGTLDLYQRTTGAGKVWFGEEPDEEVIGYVKFNPNRQTNGEASYRDRNGIRAFRTGTGTWTIENDGTILNDLDENWAVSAASGANAYINLEYMIAGLAGVSVDIETWGSGNGANTGQPGTVTVFIRQTNNGNLVDVTNNNGHIYLSMVEV